MITNKNITPEFVEFYRLISMGNDEALAFLLMWHEYCHLWDDLVDLFMPPPELMMRTAALAIDVYSCPFFLKHSAELRGVAKSITCSYMTSVGWENGDDKWKRQCADVLRHSGNDMVYAVADIVGGWTWRMNVADVLSNRVMLDRNEPD
jgi:hypothetical protein